MIKKHTFKQLDGGSDPRHQKYEKEKNMRKILAFVCQISLVYKLFFISCKLFMIYLKILIKIMYI